MFGVSAERRRIQRGMTLVELIVAFTILALLALMAVPLARSRVRREREKELRVALREIHRMRRMKGIRNRWKCWWKA